MSRPLELTVWPLWFNGLDGTCYANKDDDRRPVNVDFEVMRKQLTSTELAALFWHSWNLFKTGSPEHRDWTEYDRANTLRRFAQTPHYDELPDRSTA